MRREAAACAARAERAEAELERAQAALQEAAAAHARVPELSAQLEGLAEVRPLMAQLRARGGDLALAQETLPASQAADWDTAWDALGRLEAALPGLKRAQEDAQEAAAAAERAERAVTETEATIARTKEQLRVTCEEGKAAGAHKERCKEALEAARAQDQAAALRPHLHVGEPCPVCDQVVRDLPPPRPSQVAALQRAFDDAEARLQALRERYQAEKGRLGMLRQTLDDRREALERAQALRTRQTARLAEAEAVFRELGTTDPEALARLLRARRRELLVRLAQRICERTGGRDPEVAYRALSRERGALEAALRTAQSALAEARAARERERAAASAAASRLRDQEAEALAAAQRLSEALAQSPFKDAAAVRQAALAADRQAALATRLERYARDLEAAERESAKFSAELAGRTFDAEALSAVRRELSETEAALEAAQRRVGELSGELGRLERQLERAKALRQELAQARDEASLYTELDRDLHTQRFPSYLLDRVQRELALRASDILRRVTDGRFDLRFEGGEYSVLDAWSGELRSAKTLSGGESFITSLALALALSDTLAGSTALGALFLDEGFGTLDAETLDAVAGVLESLTVTGRMVGVITHVQELTERLPARLIVRKTPAGSVAAWEV